MSEYDATDTRRRFVKKTIIGTIALSQPLLFTGLIRAQGGGSSSSTLKDSTYDESTDFSTEFPVSGDPGETTIPEEPPEVIYD